MRCAGAFDAGNTGAARASRAFADDETPAEKVERLRKEISALHEQIKDSEASEKNAQQTKLYYQQLSNTLSAQLAALQEDIEVRKSDLEKKNLAIAQAAEELEAARDAFEERLARHVRDALFQQSFHSSGHRRHQRRHALCRKPAADSRQR